MAESESFTREYLIPAEQYDPADNDRQNNDVRNSAIQQGWHPTGDVSFDGTEEQDTSLLLKYSVPVVLASDAEDYLEKHPRVDQEDHAALVKDVEGDDGGADDGGGDAPQVTTAAAKRTTKKGDA